MRRNLRIMALAAVLACAAGAMTDVARAAPTQKLAAGEWFVRAPAKGLKDLPSLAAERDFSSDDTALSGIAAKVPTFTAFCETGKRLDRSHFAG